MPPWPHGARNEWRARERYTDAKGPFIQAALEGSRTRLIRPFESRDIDETLRVFRAACDASHPFLPAAFLDKTETEMRKRRLLELHTDVFDDGGIRGFLSRNGGYVDALFIDPPFQRRGIGKQLLDHLKGQVSVALLSVFAQNPRAIKFYQREEFWAVKLDQHRETGESTVLLKWEAPK